MAGEASANSVHSAIAELERQVNLLPLNEGRHYNLLNNSMKKTSGRLSSANGKNTSVTSSSYGCNNSNNNKCCRL